MSFGFSEKPNSSNLKPRNNLKAETQNNFRPKIISAINEPKTIVTEVEQKTRFLASFASCLQNLETAFYADPQIKSNIHLAVKHLLDLDREIPLQNNVSDDRNLLLHYVIETLDILISQISTNSEINDQQSILEYLYLPLMVSNFISIKNENVRNNKYLDAVNEFTATGFTNLFTIFYILDDPAIQNNKSGKDILVTFNYLRDVFYYLDNQSFDNVQNRYTPDKSKDQEILDEIQFIHQGNIPYFKELIFQPNHNRTMADFLAKYRKGLQLLPSIAGEIKQQIIYLNAHQKILDFKIQNTPKDNFQYLTTLLQKLLSGNDDNGDLNLNKNLKNLYLQAIFELKLQDWQNQFSNQFEELLSGYNLDELQLMLEQVQNHKIIQPWLLFVAQKLDLPPYLIAENCIYDTEEATLQDFINEVLVHKLALYNTHDLNRQSYDLSMKLTNPDFLDQLNTSLEIFFNQNEYTFPDAQNLVNNFNILSDEQEPPYDIRVCLKHLSQSLNTNSFLTLDDIHLNQNFFIIQDILLKNLRKQLYLLQLKQLKVSETKFEPDVLSKVRQIFSNLDATRYEFEIPGNAITVNIISANIFAQWKTDLSCLVAYLNKVNRMQDLISYNALRGNDLFQGLTFKQLTNKQGRLYSIRLKPRKIADRAIFELSKGYNGKQKISLLHLGNHD